MGSSTMANEYWMPEKGIEDSCFKRLLDFWFHDSRAIFDATEHEQILKLVSELNVQPIIYQLTRQRKIKSSGDLPWMNVVRTQALQIAATCAYRHHILKELSNLFYQSGICPIWLKGPGLGNSVYPRPEWRTYKDFDLLIAPSQWSKAVHLMNNAGYNSARCLNWGFLSFEKSFHPINDIPGSVDVELHYKLSNRPRLNIFSYEELLEDVKDLSNFSFSFLVPHPVKHFIYVCLHRVGHHPNDRRFTWLLDMMYLIENFNEQDWSQVLELSDRKQVSKIILKSLNDIQLIFLIEVPKFVTVELTKQSESRSEPSEIFLSFQRNKWMDLWSRWWDMPGLAIKLKYLSHWAFPPKNYMDELVGSNPLVIQHKDRFVNGIKKYFGGD